MEEKRICSECGTENEEKYRFCKNCGKELEAEGFEQQTYGNVYNQYVNVENGYMNMPEIEGIPADEVSAFVGKKAPKIVRKFAKMQVTSSKASWCWPVAILSYFFGPIGAAFWYLYRKMYKLAIIFFAIGIVLSAATSFISVSGLLPGGDGASFEEIVDTYEDFVRGEITFEEYMEDITGALSDLGGIGNAVEEFFNIATLVITGIFSYYWYKKHTVKSIMKVRASNTDPRYYHFALSAVGGTSFGSVVIGVVIYAVLDTVISVAVSLILGSPPLF